MRRNAWLYYLQGKPYPLLLLVLWEYSCIYHLPVVHPCQTQAHPRTPNGSVAITSQSQAEEKKLEVGEAIMVSPQPLFQNADKILLSISKIHRHLLSVHLCHASWERKMNRL